MRTRHDGQEYSAPDTLTGRENLESLLRLPLLIEAVICELVHIAHIRLLDRSKIHSQVVLKERLYALRLEAVENPVTLAGRVVCRAVSGVFDEFLKRRTVFASVSIPEESRKRPALRVESFDLLALKANHISCVHGHELVERPKVMIVARLSQSLHAHRVIIEIPSRQALVPADRFKLCSNSLFQERWKTALEVARNILVPAFVRCDGIGVNVADEISYEPVTYRVAAAIDLQVDLRVFSGVLFGECRPLDSIRKHVTLHWPIAGLHGRRQLLVLRVRAFHHLCQSIVELLFFDRGVDDIVRCLKRLPRAITIAPLLIRNRLKGRWALPPRLFG